MAAATLVRYVLFGSAALFAVAVVAAGRAAAARRARSPRSARIPCSEPTNAAPFPVTVGGIEYTVQPVFTYDLSGVVVSKHDADTWWDWIHKAWRDELNVTDLCVIWGANARSANYRELEYWSSQFECNVRTGSTEVWRAFDMTALSNNHLLTDDPTIARTLKSMRVGDQVHFRGYLAQYSHEHGFHFVRGTSTKRTDTGNGACETVYATDAEILRARAIAAGASPSSSLRRRSSDRCSCGSRCRSGRRALSHGGAEGAAPHAASGSWRRASRFSMRAARRRSRPPRSRAR